MVTGSNTLVHYGQAVRLTDTELTVEEVASGGRSSACSQCLDSWVPTEGAYCRVPTVGCLLFHDQHGLG